jgi:hypothetical protein
MGVCVFWAHMDPIVNVGIMGVGGARVLLNRRLEDLLRWLVTMSWRRQPVELSELLPCPRRIVSLAWSKNCSGADHKNNAIYENTCNKD